MRRNSMHSAGLSGAIALLIAALIGCGGESPTTTPTPADDAVSLSSITPAAGTVLHANEMVTFTATLNYTLASAESGQVVIVIQDQLNQNLKPQGVPQPTAAVMRGTGTVTLTDSILIPGSGVTSVRVVFPLALAGATRTEVLVSVSYPVG
jgi:hypothetical protein